MSRKKRLVIRDGDKLKLECTKCGRVLLSENFGKWNRGPDGYKYECKECRKKDYNDNKEEILLNRKKYYNENSDKKREYQRAYYNNNSESVKAQHRIYRELNRSKIKEKRREFYIANKEDIKKKNIDYSIRKTQELGFGWRKFHDKTSGYIRRHNLMPNKCSICKSEDKIIAHHPSYSSFNDWKFVVFVCCSCHQDIHKGNIECPTPIDLVKLKTKWQKQKRNLNDGNENVWMLMLQ